MILILSVLDLSMLRVQSGGAKMEMTRSTVETLSLETFRLQSEGVYQKIAL
jgi:hypothetical protein